MSSQIGDYIYDTRAVQNGDFSVMLTRVTNLLTNEVHLNANIYQYLGNKEDVVIPRTVAGYTVTEIATNAFLGNKNIVRVRFPDTVKKIGTNAFMNCKNLKTVWVIDSFSNRRTKELWLSDNVFYGCENLTEVKTRNKEILTYAASGNQFNGCVNLKKIDSALKYIRPSTLSGCPALEEIFIAHDGFIEHKSFVNAPAIKCIHFCGNIDINNMSKRELRRIAKMDIICPADSNVVELAYLGANVQVV